MRKMLFSFLTVLIIFFTLTISIEVAAHLHRKIHGNSNPTVVEKSKKEISPSRHPLLPVLVVHTK